MSGHHSAQRFFICQNQDRFKKGSAPAPVLNCQSWVPLVRLWLCLGHIEWKIETRISLKQELWFIPKPLRKERHPQAETGWKLYTTVQAYMTENIFSPVWEGMRRQHCNIIFRSKVCLAVMEIVGRSVEMFSWNKENESVCLGSSPALSRSYGKA